MDDESTKVIAKAFFALCCDFYLLHKRTREKNFTHCDGKCLHLANEICNWVENSEIQLCDDALGLRFSIHESLSNYRVWKKQQVTFALEQAKTKLEKGFWKIDSIFWAFLRYWSPFYLYFFLNRICCCHRTEFNTLSSF